MVEMTAVECFEWKQRHLVFILNTACYASLPVSASALTPSAPSSCFSGECKKTDYELSVQNVDVGF